MSQQGLILREMSWVLSQKISTTVVTTQNKLATLREQRDNLLNIWTFWITITPTKQITRGVKPQSWSASAACLQAWILCRSSPFRTHPATLISQFLTIAFTPRQISLPFEIILERMLLVNSTKRTQSQVSKKSSKKWCTAGTVSREALSKHQPSLAIAHSWEAPNKIIWTGQSTLSITQMSRRRTGNFKRFQKPTPRETTAFTTTNLSTLSLQGQSKSVGKQKPQMGTWAWSWWCPTWWPRGKLVSENQGSH